MMDKRLLLAFYGDDFTGSTDALEFLCRAGARAVLFIEPPTSEQLAAYPGLNAIGVAGKTRSVSPDDMQLILQPAFEQLKRSGAKHVHYKVCSTFDSSPSTGSIGKTIDIGAAVFGNSFIPVLGAAPALGRYCVFGNLFARMGIGSDGGIFRLDRHPSMSKHPVTPANESDLRLHLENQTEKKIALLDILQLAKTVPQLREIVDALLAGKEEVLLIDALYEDQLFVIGELLDSYAVDKPLFSVGSSGIEMALGKCWNKNGVLTPVKEWMHPGKAAPLLVISGSCSPVTSAQIVWANNNNFSGVVMDAESICNAVDILGAAASFINETIDLLKAGKNVIVHTGNKQSRNLPSDKLGTALGFIAKEAVQRTGVKRVVVSGGDTSSYAARAMEIEAVEMIAPLVAGAPLCRASSKNKAIDGIEINFKGGQVGAADYFGVLLEGKLY
jgi:uncharacterized protein YgbK (DUF1537 family)